MSDYLSTVIVRNIDPGAVLRPRPVTRFEPPADAAALPVERWGSPAEDEVPIADRSRQALPRAAARAPAANTPTQESPVTLEQMIPEDSSPAAEIARDDPERSLSFRRTAPTMRPAEPAQPLEHPEDDPLRPSQEAPGTAASDTPSHLANVHPRVGREQPVRAVTDPAEGLAGGVSNVSPGLAADGPDLHAIAQAIRRLLPGDAASGAESDLSPVQAVVDRQPEQPSQNPDMPPRIARPVSPQVIRPAGGQPERDGSPATINITIGRVIVRATPPPPKQTRQQPTPAIMSLDEYLRQQANGGTP